MDELLRLLVTALESGMEITITLRSHVTESGENTATCKHCGWSKSYKRPDNARRGLRAHLRHCSKKSPTGDYVIPQWLYEQQNGHKPDNK